LKEIPHVSERFWWPHWLAYDGMDRNCDPDGAHNNILKLGSHKK
jgi:hypothetical protein